MIIRWCGHVWPLATGCEVWIWVERLPSSFETSGIGEGKRYPLCEVMCVCLICVSVRKEYLLISAIMASVGLCVLCVSLQANGGRHKASLKGTQIDCLLAVCAPFWWSPKIKTSFFISGCEKAAMQSTMDFLPLHKCFSSTLSTASPSVHCTE